MIHCKEETVEREGRSHLLAQGLPNALTDQDWTNPTHFNLGVITRDLFHLFPYNILKNLTGRSLEVS